MQNRLFRQLAMFVIAGLTLLNGLFKTYPNSQQQNPKPTTEQSKPKPPRITSHVILISISGLRADYANDPEAHRLKIPHIQSLRSKGSHAFGVESVYPSQSKPAHVTISTGVLPADHGITSDYAFDEQTGRQSATPHWMAEEIKADTLWAAAKREDLTTAAIGYPVTAHSTINFNLPEITEKKDGIKNSTELRTYSNPPGLYDEVTSALKLKSEARTLDTKSDVAAYQASDIFNAEAAAYLIEKHRPNLLLINLKSFDLAQNRYGLSSKEAIVALTLIDDLVGKIVAATEVAKLAGETTFLIVSDHGASKVEREFRPNVLLAKRGLLTVDDQGEVKAWQAVAQSFGGSAAIFLKNPKDEKAVQEVRKIFSELEQDSDNPLWRITSQRDAAKLGADPRALFFLDAAPPYRISARGIGSMIARTDDRSAHGYLPSRAEMRASLILSGRGIKTNQRVEYARLTDIAPTIAQLLGLEMKIVRGRVLAEVIAQ